MAELNAIQEKVQATPVKVARLPVPIRWIRELLAIALWSLAFTQLLILDVVGHLSTTAPSLETALRYRFLFILGIVALLWLLLGNRLFMSFVGYVIAYPFVVVFWIIPKMIFRNWAVVVAFSPAIHSIITTFRYSFILFSAAVISSFAICLVADSWSIISCMAFLALYLILHFARRFRVAFSPSTAFADLGGGIRHLWVGMKEKMLTKPPDGLDPQSTEYKQKFGQGLLSIYMTATALYVLGERLREVMNSRKLDLYFVASLLYTFFLTFFVFALEYFGLERIVPGSFAGSPQPGLFEFLGLSFSTLMTSDISPLKPISGLAQLASYVQLFGSLLIIVLLVFVVLTSIRERYRQDLDAVVNELRAASETTGSFLESNWELTIAGAEAALLEFNPVVTKWFLNLRYGDKRAQEITESH